MTRTTHKGLTFIVILIFASAAQTQDGSENGIWSHEAKNHIGEFAMVCGVIVGVRRARTSGGVPPVQLPYQTYFYPISKDINLYFDKLPPHHEFVAVIANENRGAFLDKPESFVDQKACVYGKIRKHKSNVNIELVIPDQIALEGIETDGK